MGSYALVLEPKRCKGCLLCVSSCPKQILFLNGSGKIAVKEIEPCIFCRICEMRCPDFAIWVEKALSPSPVATGPATKYEPARVRPRE